MWETSVEVANVVQIFFEGINGKILFDFFMYMSKECSEKFLNNFNGILEEIPGNFFGGFSESSWEKILNGFKKNSRRVFFNEFL